MSAPTDLDDPTVVALFLLSVAARPLPPAFEDADYFQIDRAELWKLAFAANVPLGRNTFHATVAAIAEETEAVTVDRFVGSNRRFVRLGIPEADEYTWLNEIFAELEFDDLSAAIDAAADRGFDTETALPTELALPVSQGAEERRRDREAGGWDDYDDEAPELTEKACTKCGAVQPLREFPERSTGRLSSWCRSCHRAATEDWKKRNPGHDRDNTSYLRYGDRSWDEITAAQPHRNGVRAAGGCFTPTPSPTTGTAPMGCQLTAGRAATEIASNEAPTNPA
jgi:hypothetical protein